MKNLIHLLLATSLLFGAGCQTTDDPRTAEDRIESSVRAAATIGTYEILRERPDWEPYFEEAMHELAALTAHGTVDFWVVYEIVQRLPVEELRSERAIVYITTTNMVLEEFGNPSIDLDVMPNAHPIAWGLMTGIERGLTLAGGGRER